MALLVFLMAVISSSPAELADEVGVERFGECTFFNSSAGCVGQTQTDKNFFTFSA
jgi:hypothetical protein